MRPALPALVVLLVVAAGCITTGTPPTGGTETTPTPTDTESGTPTTDSHTERTTSPVPTASLDLASSGVPCDEGLWVGFYGINPSFGDWWDRDTVRIGYHLPRNTSVHLVAYVDGEVRGVASRNTSGDEILDADGDRIDLNTSFSGKHVVRVVIYDDEDSNGTFEDGIDRPCLNDPGVVQAGPKTVDFSQYADES